MMDDFDGPTYRKSRETRAAFIARELERAKAALAQEPDAAKPNPEFWRSTHAEDMSDAAIAKRLGFTVGDHDGRDD
jgi:hypothetical protein